MAAVSTVLPQGVGYGVVVGIGSFFTVAMIGISMLQVLSGPILGMQDANLCRTNIPSSPLRPVKNLTPRQEM